MGSFDKGKSFEQKVAAMIRKKADSGSMRNRGSHANWHRRSDVFTNLPIHVEVKDHETVKVKEWYRQADAASSFNQTPTVVFHCDEEVLTILRFNDLLDLFVQVADLQAEIEDLRKPLPITQPKPIPKVADKVLDDLEKPVKKMVQRGSQTCRAGHLADQWGYCMQLSCKYSRGYKAPKKKR